MPNIFFFAQRSDAIRAPYGIDPQRGASETDIPDKERADPI